MMRVVDIPNEVRLEEIFSVRLEFENTTDHASRFKMSCGNSPVCAIGDTSFDVGRLEPGERSVLEFEAIALSAGIQKLCPITVTDLSHKARSSHKFEDYCRVLVLASE